MKYQKSRSALRAPEDASRSRGDLQKRKRETETEQMRRAALDLASVPWIRERMRMELRDAESALREFGLDAAPWFVREIERRLRSPWAAAWWLSHLIDVCQTKAAVGQDVQRFLRGNCKNPERIVVLPSAASRLRVDVEFDREDPCFVDIQAAARWDTKEFSEVRRWMRATETSVTRRRETRRRERERRADVDGLDDYFKWVATLPNVRDI